MDFLDCGDYDYCEQYKNLRYVFFESLNMDVEIPTMSKIRYFPDVKIVIRPGEKEILLDYGENIYFDNDRFIKFIEYAGIGKNLVVLFDNMLRIFKKENYISLYTFNQRQEINAKLEKDKKIKQLEENNGILKYNLEISDAENDRLKTHIHRDDQYLTKINQLEELIKVKEECISILQKQKDTTEQRLKKLNEIIKDV